MYDGWFEQGRCTLTINVDCWYYSDSYCVEVNLVILACLVYYLILNIGSLSLYMYVSCDVFYLWHHCVKYIVNN